MKKIVVLSGAGISAESGIPTFRGSGGLWEGHDVRQVASPMGWVKDQEMVLRFYNERRRNMGSVKPNAGHLALADMEEDFDVTVITQNIDDLHEQAGSTDVLHLHGEIKKARSTVDPELIYDIGIRDINLGDLCEKGSQLRPHIVWFGEDVPLIREAAAICTTADYFIIVGTSLQVYPAAGLVDYTPDHCKIFLIDPNQPDYKIKAGVEFINEPGTTGVSKVAEIIRSENK